MDEETKKTADKEPPEEEDPGEEPGNEASGEEQEPSLVAAGDAGEETGQDREAEEPAPEKKSGEKKSEKDRGQATDELLRTRERMLRIAADFENFRKRSKKDLQDAEHKARVDILKEMLPIFDNLARAVEHGESVTDLEPIIQGARMVTKQFEEKLARFGLKRIKSVGEVFDPMVHDAISQEESAEAKPGTVIKEFLAGYMLGDKLLRAAMVVVARVGSGSGAKKKDDDGDRDAGG